MKLRQSLVLSIVLIPTMLGCKDDKGSGGGAPGATSCAPSVTSGGGNGPDMWGDWAVTITNSTNPNSVGETFGFFIDHDLVSNYLFGSGDINGECIGPVNITGWQNGTSFSLTLSDSIDSFYINGTSSNGLSASGSYCNNAGFCEAESGTVSMIYIGLTKPPVEDRAAAPEPSSEMETGPQHEGSTKDLMSLVPGFLFGADSVDTNDLVLQPIHEETLHLFYEDGNSERVQISRDLLINRR